MIFFLGGSVSSLMQADHKLPTQPLNSVPTLEISKEPFENLKGIISVAYWVWICTITHLFM